MERELKAKQPDCQPAPAQTAEETNRIDYESPLENLFNGLMACSGCLGAGALALLLISLAFAVLGWFYGEDASGWTRPIPKIFFFLIISLLVTGLFGWIRSGIDICYFLDPERRQVLLHRKVFFYRRESVVVRFQDLHCLAVAGKFVSESQGKGKPAKEYWKTALWLVTKRGRKIRISDYKPHGTWSPEESPLPQTLGLELLSSPTADHALKIRRGPKGLEVTFGSDFWSFLGCFWSIALTLALGMGLGWLGDWLK